MWRTRRLANLHIGLVVMAFLLFPGMTLALSQDEVPPPTEQPPAPPPAQAPQPPPASQPAAPGDVRALTGSCQSGANAVMLSQPFLPRAADLQWWAVGFTPGTNVGVQLADPTGKTTQLGSVAVDNICEASGSFQSSAQQQAGLYTLTISGTKVAGGTVDLSVPITIVSFVVPTPATSSGAAVPPPPPARPGGVRATAVNQTTIRLDWTDNSNDEQGFRIDSGAGQFRTGPNVTTFNVGGLQADHFYCFTVFAFNANGESFGGSTDCAVTTSTSSR